MTATVWIQNFSKIKIRVHSKLAVP